MDKKDNVGKYVLVFEPKGSPCQYAMYFKSSSEVEITPIKKYTFKPYDGSNPKKIKRNTLAEIDNHTTLESGMEDFCNKYIDPNVFTYTGNNLHKMFIGYVYKDYMYTLDCIFNDKELNRNLRFVEGNQMVSGWHRQNLVDLISSKECGFTEFALNRYNNKNTSMNRRTVDSMVNLNTYVKSNDDRGGEFQFLESEVLSSLTSYKEYREMYLLQKLYSKKLSAQKKYLYNQKRTLEEFDRKTKEAAKKNVNTTPTGEFQLDFFGNPVVEDTGKKNRK